MKKKETIFPETIFIMGHAIEIEEVEKAFILGSRVVDGSSDSENFKIKINVNPSGKRELMEVFSHEIYHMYSSLYDSDFNSEQRALINGKLWSNVFGQLVQHQTKVKEAKNDSTKRKSKPKQKKAS
jgi:hypothetical protein